ncbi:MAG: hypothetical protein JST92_15700 [Deltaproteobacteria bacterium]|nr:hypothetical protein [Deltaproteobacteria bacterium]
MASEGKPAEPIRDPEYARAVAREYKRRHRIVSGTFAATGLGWIAMVAAMNFAPAEFLTGWLAALALVLTVALTGIVSWVGRCPHCSAAVIDDPARDGPEGPGFPLMRPEACWSCGARFLPPEVSVRTHKPERERS